VKEHTNKLGQLIGAPLPGWRPVSSPPRSDIEGRYCRIEPINPERHALELYESVMLDVGGGNWTYLPYGPFPDRDDYVAWLEQTCLGDDPMFHTVIDLASGKAVGIASLMRISPSVGVIEIGHIHYSPALQRTPIATEAMYLFMTRVFDELGYRRFEWKCDSLNKPSNNAALRYGFKFEGIFRQATVYKQRNRDTAWYSMLDSEWPLARAAYEAWLSPGNFDDNGVQRRRLSAFMSGNGGESERD